MATGEQIMNEHAEFESDSPFYLVLDVVAQQSTENIGVTSSESKPHARLACASTYSAGEGLIRLFDESTVGLLARQLMEAAVIVGYDLENDYRILAGYEGIVLANRGVDMDLRDMVAGAEPGLSTSLDDLCKANYGLPACHPSGQLQQLWMHGNILAVLEGSVNRLMRKQRLYQDLHEKGWLYVPTPEFHRVDIPHVRGFAS
jgi:hypothetical protein